MDFDLATARPLLERTPRAVREMLRDLPAPWAELNEGPGTWTVFDVVGHLIHGEDADWIPRARRILDHGTTQPFDPFDRDAQFEASRGKTLNQLLDEFDTARARSLAELDALQLTPDLLARQGVHPAFGTVTLGQLLATWVTHDLDHIVQISRVLAKGYTEAVGPWRAYLRVVREG